MLYSACMECLVYTHTHTYIYIFIYIINLFLNKDIELTELVNSQFLIPVIIGIKARLCQQLFKLSSTNILSPILRTVFKISQMIRGAYDKFPDIFRMGSLIDSTHMKL